MQNLRSFSLIEERISTIIQRVTDEILSVRELVGESVTDFCAVARQR
jgi:hypothetical protein